MDSTIVSTSSLPCLQANINDSKGFKHGTKSKHLGMASEPLLSLPASDLEKSDCSNNIIAIACEGTHIGSDGNVSGTYPLEYCFFCSQSGPVIEEKVCGDQKSRGKAEFRSLQDFSSVDSSRASSTPQLRVNSCDNLMKIRFSLVPVLQDGSSKTELNGTKNSEEQSVSSSNEKSSEVRDSCGLMCRICHGGFEEGELIRPCKCTGTVKYAHQNCILHWVSKSGNHNCELCKFKFRTRKESVKCFWKWRFPEISTKGWLHIGLFIAFATMLLTSITWIIWSRVSRTPSAVAERTTEEVKFAYMVNGLFIALAVGGLYFDSLKHFKQYSKRWRALNQNVVVESYTSDRDTKKESVVPSCSSNENRHWFVSIAVEETEAERQADAHRNHPYPPAWI
ncbi:E3 ubiquitin-protein ligase MARCHF1-like [Montipora capricornis]|uniref:E3 ubiquitin-protein ligase MARCHF1-like n=1 Tax=Montipora capricornis TaxID=246305 RepID=UPI0035F109A3